MKTGFVTTFATEQEAEQALKEWIKEGNRAESGMSGYRRGYVAPCLGDEDGYRVYARNGSVSYAL